ncbi:tetrapyrrole methylase [Phyllosticta citriasiana]|uniref:precorrin-2 dehydrogenase n=1 Tax=Phyllosticta citriasiana TaxID=595635 RepID=A0ABR1KLE2_9PEZI
MAPALLTAVDSTFHVHLIVGSNPLAGARCSKSIEVGAKPILIAPESSTLHYGLLKRIENGEVEWLKRDFQDGDLTSLGREDIDGVVDAVFVTLGGKNPKSTHISTLCRRLRIPINVADAPNLCTFTLLSTHSDGPLQIGVTTSGKGCKLSSRIRREIASSLPTGLGQAVERLGTMRRRIWEEDHAAELSMDPEAGEDDAGQNAHFNRLVTPEDAEAARGRRMRWLAQICEYWPLSRLSSITDEDVETVLQSYTHSDSSSINPSSIDARRTRGRIILAGSGPGHPDLLTRATHKAIVSADLILADKLVPAPILALIPRRTPVHIARKFPGNAEAAQEELLSLGLAGVQEGKIVLRLKQGDPYIYGRGAEEYTFFSKHGYSPVVLPGITSALSAPLFAAIPPTHRSVADQVLICTGTGRKGAAPTPPPYNPSQTVVFLMALHRLSSLIDSLVQRPAEGNNGAAAAWPASTPCAVLERASCPDQRVIRSTLGDVVAAVEEEGSRPPGLLVVGAACEVLFNPGGQRWIVEEGFRGLDGWVGDADLTRLVDSVEADSIKVAAA